MTKPFIFMSASFLLVCCCLLLFLGQAQATKKIAVALCQTAAFGANPQTLDFSSMENCLQTASNNGAEFAVFGESIVYGWLNPGITTFGMPIPSQITATVAAMSRKYNLSIVLGMVEKTPVGLLYDTAVLIDNVGKLRLKHRKVNVLEHAFSDNSSYAAGKISAMRTVTVNGVKIGLLVCSDTYKYGTGIKVLKKMASLNPEVVFVPYGYCAGKPFKKSCVGYGGLSGVAGNASVAYSAPTVGTNGIGERLYGRFLPSQYCGMSVVTDKSGKVIHQLGYNTNQTAVVEVPLSSQ
eukprot:TRINITY_DN95796_c0_g1_i1.p1 TRINITY_DN95796_c0_g1~~TRINITY_DN95796_c0_g1_i1.p1  ORF type:complete len:294 (+),score=34.37 TRINITY_DN95796_c0_g1_i1:61-942(+)